MRVDTILKLGSLAFGVAQDERVRELATMIHKGAKRRGILAPSVAQGITKAAEPLPPSSQVKAPASRIPFAPGSTAPQSTGGLEKFLTVDNAKKALGWAGIVKDLLVK